MHWAYGVGWGALYGLVAGSVRLLALRSGLVFGAAVWTTGHIVLPLAKVYKPLRWRSCADGSCCVQ